MYFSVHELEKDDVLAGAARGASLVPRLVAGVTAANPKIGGPVFLDFVDIRVATGSYLREAILGFRDFCHRSRPELCPVVANASPAVLEELADLLNDKRDALVVCVLDKKGKPQAPLVIGLLEEKQRVTLRAVLDLGEVDAGKLADHFEKDDPIGITGWNNRLALLAAKGILAESRLGRGKRYRPVLEGLDLGN